MTRSEYYILDAFHRAIPASYEQWVKYRMANKDQGKRVAETNTGLFWISTVFLGMDHAFGEGPPLIFETMVFDKGTTCEAEDVPFDTCVRYSTWDEATEGHATMVEMVRQVEAYARTHLK